MPKVSCHGNLSIISLIDTQQLENVAQMFSALQMNTGRPMVCSTDLTNVNISYDITEVSIAESKSFMTAFERRVYGYIII